MRFRSGRILSVILLAAGVLIGLSGQGRAFIDKPAAIIEDIKAPSTDLELMQFLFTGDTIKLADTETLKLSYLRSCIIEEFEGGIVTVGETQSVVTGGSLRFREEVDCDGGGIVPTNGQREGLAGIVFRIPGTTREVKLVEVYATAPVFAFAETVKELVIKREDSGLQEEFRFAVNGRVLDLADKDVQFAVGGTYRAETEMGAVAFHISRGTTAINSPAISRLVGF